MMMGAFFFGRAADKYGRVIVIKTSVVLCFTCGLSSALFNNFGVLLAFRMFTGMGLGGVGVCFSYFLEMVPSSLRGKYALLLQMSWTLATMLEV